jgi:hypothetical protein
MRMVYKQIPPLSKIQNTDENKQCNYQYNLTLNQADLATPGGLVVAICYIIKIIGVKES